MTTSRKLGPGLYTTQCGTWQIQRHRNVDAVIWRVSQSNLAVLEDRKAPPRIYYGDFGTKAEALRWIEEKGADAAPSEPPAPSHGGRRRGAGRPFVHPRYRKVPISASVTWEQREWLHNRPEGVSGALQQLLQFALEHIPLVEPDDD